MEVIFRYKYYTTWKEWNSYGQQTFNEVAVFFGEKGEHIWEQRVREEATMSNTIHVNYMTRAYNQYQQKSVVKEQEREDTRFVENVREKSQGSGNIASSSKIDSVSAKDMTMEEYKQYVYDKISQIPMHPTRASESISITISEAGFEAMKNDPEYEAWVLNDLQVGWSQPDNWSGICGGAFSTIHYGASKEECHAEMWSAGYHNGNGGKIFNDKSQNSFWERRMENKKRIENQVKEQQEKKQIQKKQAERTAYEEYVQNRRLSAQVVSMRLAFESSLSDKTVTTSQAATSYEANFAKE